MGARTANIIAALWPERCKALVSVSGYLIGSQESGKMPLPGTIYFRKPLRPLPKLSSKSTVIEISLWKISLFVRLAFIA